MHFEILVEDASGELLLGSLLPKILGEYGDPHTWRTHAYKGIGRVPRDLRGKTDPAKRILLDRLPKVLAGYGKSLQGSDSAVIVVVDLDDRECVGFKQELLQVLKRCHPKPQSSVSIRDRGNGSLAARRQKGDPQGIPESQSCTFSIPMSRIRSAARGRTLADAVFPGGSLALKVRKGGRGLDKRSANGHLRLEGTLMSTLTFLRASASSSVACGSCVESRNRTKVTTAIHANSVWIRTGSAAPAVPR